MEKLKTGVFLNNEFINLYSKENPILEVDDFCYGLIFNTIDYHRPLIVYGQIVSDKFSDGMNKIYYLKIKEIIETPITIKKFFEHKQFSVNQWVKNSLKSKHLIYVNSQISFNFEENLFPITSFFVRNSLQKITEVREEYISIVKKDLKQMLADIDVL